MGNGNQKKGALKMKEYLTTAQTAKLVRATLKASFPGVKFSVRSDGSALRIEYTDGPTTKAVNSVVQAYAGGGFDGSIDMAYYKSHWLNQETGEVCLARNQGSVCSGGYVQEEENACPGEGWVCVSFGCKYVFVTQHLTEQVMTEGLEITQEKCSNWVDHAFELDEVTVKVSEYSGGAWIDTTVLVQNHGWNQLTQEINNLVHENAQLVACGNYYLN